MQPLSVRHCHSHQINQENQGGPTLAPSTSSVIYTSQSTDHCTKSQPTTSSSPSSLSSSLISFAEHGRNEQTQLLFKQKKSSSQSNSLTHMADCCSAHSVPNATLKVNAAATVQFADSTPSSSTKQSPLSSQIEQNAHHTHDAHRSIHVIRHTFYSIATIRLTISLCCFVVVVVVFYISHTNRGKQVQAHWHSFLLS